ncbi:transposon Tf2-6 polyprotein [Trichonephila inaurata madagascariensis]|uniref:Transposon Tf2-6 polyprotein n=1 Tax=Trichonephila inaurata madagascariensis TaxID=2747483 RepID=A0A8X6KMX8_9ARAC|nr:transposon Tf2-6 polyprotein [Trichonephila inaurata madagascariensis]
MYRNVVRYVMHCRECQRRKSVPQRPPGRLVPIPPAIAPFHRIGIDLLGRFPKSSHGNKWISLHGLLNTVCDNESLADSRSRRNSKVLTEEIILRHGAPRVITYHRSWSCLSIQTCFLSSTVNVDHRFTTAYHPSKWTDRALQRPCRHVVYVCGCRAEKLG